MGGFGDSITDASVTSWFHASVVQLAALNYHTTEKNWAVAGQTQDVSFATAQAKLPLLHYSFATWFPWSPNDIDPDDPATGIYHDYNTYVQAFIDLVHSYGGIPVIITALPGEAVHGTVGETARLDVNDQVRALASDSVIVADMESAVSDGAFPAHFKPGYSNDGVHPNMVGSAAMAPVLTAAIQAFIEAHPNRNW